MWGPLTPWGGNSGGVGPGAAAAGAGGQQAQQVGR